MLDVPVALQHGSEPLWDPSGLNAKQESLSRSDQFVEGFRGMSDPGKKSLGDNCLISQRTDNSTHLLQTGVKDIQSKCQELQGESPAHYLYQFLPQKCFLGSK